MRHIAILLMLATACATTDASDARTYDRADVRLIEDTPIADRTEDGQIVLRTIDDAPLASSGDQLCEMLPETGACADLCDPVAFHEHIPPGTCVTYVCELDDGSRVLAGGCRI
jgi:hypothetical protein